jgi:hypothetical protein
MLYDCLTFQAFVTEREQQRERKPATHLWVVSTMLHIYYAYSIAIRMTHRSVIHHAVTQITLADSLLSCTAISYRELL